MGGGRLHRLRPRGGLIRAARGRRSERPAAPGAVDAPRRAGRDPGRTEAAAIRILYVSHACYLGGSDPAIAARASVEAFARLAHEVEVLSGGELDASVGVDVAGWVSANGWRPEAVLGASAVRSDGVRATVPPHARVVHRGVVVAVHRWPPASRVEPPAAGPEEFLRLVEMTLDRFRPDVLLTPAGGRLAGEVLGRGRDRRTLNAQIILDLAHAGPAPPSLVDVTLAPTRFAADYYAEAFATPCIVAPPPGDPDGPATDRRGARYVTFVDPTPAHGAWAFARIADELGRRRPDIPLLVVEGRATEADLAACGLDLRPRGNLDVMSPTRDPREYWGVTRVAVVPSLGWGDAPGVESRAAAAGVPVVVADRGGLPELAGPGGVALPLPDRLTPATRVLPTPDEVAPWVEAIGRLWDADPPTAAGGRPGPAVRPDPEMRYRDLFAGFRPSVGPTHVDPPGRARAAVLVPHLHGVDWECEQGLRRLEQEGVRVVRRGGSSAVDVARNELASNALHDGVESMIFIDADVGFEPSDALRLLARPEPVLCGVYAKKGDRGFASHFLDGVDEVLFGPDAPGPYPVRFAATGFLRIRSWVLRRMIERLDLPLCNTRWGRGIWPFFMPTIIEQEEGRRHYLGEDWAFSHRLGLIGVTPLADTTIRLWHWGRHPFGWEDAGEGRSRYASYSFRLTGRPGPPTCDDADTR